MIKYSCPFIFSSVLHWRTLETHHLRKCFFIVKHLHFKYVINENDKSRHLPCIQQENKKNNCGLWLLWRRDNSETTRI